jgi:hypothetical protein
MNVSGDVTYARGLSRYFTDVGAKRLAQGEVDGRTSNQHELNGVNELRRVLGDEPRKDQSAFRVRFLVLEDDGPATTADGRLSWYDARSAKAAIRGPEWRAYYNAGPLSSLIATLSEGDLAVVARRPGGEIYLLFARAGTASEARLIYLFGLDRLARGLQITTIDTASDLSETQARVLTDLGIEVYEDDDSLLEDVRAQFGAAFPSSIVFSRWARAHARLREDTSPDERLLRAFRFEERMYRVLERYTLATSLGPLFGAGTFALNVDEVMEIAMSAFQRRKARAGLALENHLECEFEDAKLSFQRTVITEQRKKPDFLFPGQAAYRDGAFETRRLTMLGVKTIGKDRWRQVVTEADRIGQKHYLTLETGISTAQTNEMRSMNVQLVVPRPLHETFSPAQRSWILGLDDFIQVVRDRARS